MNVHPIFCGLYGEKKRIKKKKEKTIYITNDVMKRENIQSKRNEALKVSAFELKELERIEKCMNSYKLLGKF